MALNTCEMWFNGTEINFFSKKLRKIAQRLPPDHIASGSCGRSPRPPSVIRLNYSALLYSTHVSQFKHFPILTIILSLLLEQVPSYVPTPGHGFWSFILRYLCPLKKILFRSFWWRHCVWWQPKILNTPMSLLTKNLKGALCRLKKL